jgi:hypothetical protein
MRRRPMTIRQGRSKGSCAGKDATDREIDQLVYQFYGLSDDEIKIVEEAPQQRGRS